MNDKAWFDQIERRKAEQRQLASSFVNNSTEDGNVILDENSESPIQPLPIVNTHVVAKNNEALKALISAYKVTYSGKKGYTEPVVHADGRVSLSFRDATEAGSFSVDEAQKGHVFLIIDPKTKTVVGYSNGNGNFYHHDGTLFRKGQTLATASEIRPEDFEMPRQTSSLCR